MKFHSELPIERCGFDTNPGLPGDQARARWCEVDQPEESFTTPSTPTATSLRRQIHRGTPLFADYSATSSVYLRGEISAGSMKVESIFSTSFPSAFAAFAA